VAGFPNLFYLRGPNTGLGHNSVLPMVEILLVPLYLFARANAEPLG
jgi:hypothetical protein